MTLNALALNTLFQAFAALIIFAVGFFALFTSLIVAVAFARLTYLGAAWASKGLTTYAQRGVALAVQPAPGSATPMLAWRDRLVEMPAAPRPR